MKRALMILVILAASFSTQAGDVTYDVDSVFVALIERCAHCPDRVELAKMSVVALWEPSDLFDYVLTGQNTDNVFRWHNHEALKKLWNMEYGLYQCFGKFTLEYSDGRYFYVHQLKSCRKASSEEKTAYDRVDRFPR